MDKDFKPVINLMLFIMIVLWVFTTCAGCSISRGPAKQTTESNNPPLAPRSMLVQHVDLDQDGTISAQESRSLMGDQPGVLITFATIVGSVMFASIASAWASNRWKPKSPAPAHTAVTTTTLSAHEPLAPPRNS